MSEVDEPPVILAGDGIFIAPAQKADVVGVQQLIDRGGIAAEFDVVKLDGVFVLFAAMDGFDFLVALNGDGDAGGGDGQRDEQKDGHEDDHEEDEAFLGLLALCRAGGSGLARMGHQF